MEYPFLFPFVPFMIPFNNKNYIAPGLNYNENTPKIQSAKSSSLHRLYYTLLIMIPSTSLSINPSLSPSPFYSITCSSSPSTSSSSFLYPFLVSFKGSNFSSLKPKPINLSCKQNCFAEFQRLKRGEGNRGCFLVRAESVNDMTISEVREEDEENPPPFYDYDTISRPRRIALFVEPSPFAYVSGYKNRFQNFIKYLREMGDEVMVVTTHEGVPQEFYGAKLIGSRSFPCPWYQKVPLSLALSPRIISEVARFKPDIIHASSPGIMVFGALAIAKLLSVPIVMSYHTHVPVYIPRYTFSWLVKPMWMIIKFLHRAADLTLVPSAAIGRDLEAARVTAANKIRLWNKGVDSESFHPRFRCNEMRVRLSNGEPEKPLIVHVGRIGVEKNLDFLKRVMDRLPGARIAIIGDGPYREELEKMLTGIPAVFTGMLGGEELSQAYASGDVFVMPSESETLGLVVLEAMSSGIPVVAARAGGIPDIISPEQEGKTGFLYNPGDLDDCLSKLVPLLDNKELRETMGEAARQDMEKYDWKAATKKIRNEQYNAAIWFWRKNRAQLLRPIQWLVKRLFPSPEV
uniref:Glycosyltransferase subfamily 4-like N-terminal domain-containing protein n=4 Tax=Salix TaxID=40685 RepID=A0A6N2KPQ2_SALVM